MTFRVPSNSTGRCVLVEMPEPFGPRNRDQSSESGTSATALASRARITAAISGGIGEEGYRERRSRTKLARSARMADQRFQSLEDAELADIWYALGGAAVRHPDHFQQLMDACFTELLDRRGAG